MKNKSLSRNNVARLLLAAVAFHSITGLSALADSALVPSTAEPYPLGGAKVTGEIQIISGSSLKLLLRNGQTLTVDLRAAQAAGMVPPVYVDEFIQVQGSLTEAGLMTAAAVMRAKSAPATWSPDKQ